MKRSLLEGCVKQWQVQYHDSVTKQNQEKLENTEQAKSRKRKRTLHTNQRNRQALKEEVAKAKVLGNYYMVCDLSYHARLRFAFLPIALLVLFLVYTLSYLHS